MDRKYNFSGGEPNISIEDLTRQPNSMYDHLQNAYAQALALMDRCFIVSGCVVSVGAVGGQITISAGYIAIYENVSSVDVPRLVKVDAQSITRVAGKQYLIAVLTSYPSSGVKTFVDGTSRNTWENKRGVLTEYTSYPSISNLARYLMPICDSSTGAVQLYYYTDVFKRHFRRSGVASDFTLAATPGASAVIDLTGLSGLPATAKVAYIMVQFTTAGLASLDIHEYSDTTITSNTSVATMLQDNAVTYASAILEVPLDNLRFRYFFTYGVGLIVSRSHVVGYRYI